MQQWFSSAQCACTELTNAADETDRLIYSGVWATQYLLYILQLSGAIYQCRVIVVHTKRRVLGAVACVSALMKEGHPITGILPTTPVNSAV